MAKAKQKHRFNAVDAVIAVLILGVLAAAGFLLFTRGTGSSDAQVSVEYVVEIRTIRDEFSDNFKVGTTLVDSVAKYRLGEITAVKVTPATFTGTNLVNGTIVYSDYPEHSNVELTVSSKAQLDGVGDYIIDGGYRISVGSTVYIRTPDYVGVGYCTKFAQTEAK